MQPNDQSQDKLIFHKGQHYQLQQLLARCCPDLVDQKHIEKFKNEAALFVYQINIQTTNFTYKIYKRIQDFTRLYDELKKKYKLAMAIPVRQNKDVKDYSVLMDLYVLFLNKLPKEVHSDPIFLHFIYKSVDKQKRKLRVYLQCFMKKHAGGRVDTGLANRFKQMFSKWQRRCFTITSQGVFYSKGYEQKQIHIKDNHSFTSHFSVQYGEKATKDKLGINLNFSQRSIQLKAESFFQFLIFINCILLSLHDNKHLISNRFGSFAPQRSLCDATYHIDGESYFYNLYEELIKAKQEVFMTGWMFTPYFMLVRPNSLDSEYRLDKVLQKLGNSGVKIHIIVFQQLKMALNNDSQHVQQYLMTLSSNIKVLRHPNFIMIPFLWSHHQKLIIIDQKVAFMGGLDICYGRMDNAAHKLIDLQREAYFWEGADYSNHRISDIYKPKDFRNSIINRQTTPRLPWHDIAIQVRGDSVIDLTRHFVQYWNFVNKRKNARQSVIMISSNSNQIVQQKEQKNEQQVLVENEIYLAQNRLNTTHKSNMKEQKVIQNIVQQLEQTHTKNIEQQQKRIKVKQSQDDQINEQQLLEQSEPLQQNEFTISLTNAQQNQFYQKYSKVYRQSINIPLRKIKSENKQYNPVKLITPLYQALNRVIIANSIKTSKGKHNHQIVRSSSKWGLGLDHDQSSIHNAYISLIQSAKDFIYIQNQFFMAIENKIPACIIKKIEEAHKEKRQFKVIVVMPLLPAFEGQVDQDTSTVLRVQLHLQYQTICRGSNSLYEKLKHIPNLDNYIQFYGLRTHGMLNNNPITQIIYVHSKLLIIDDRVVLIGSANINDRSQLGNRDSELAVIVQDQQQKFYERQKQIIMTKNFAHNLRIQIFMEHFGLKREEAQDPYKCWKQIKNRALINTQIYRNVFGCYPDDEAKSYEELRQLKKSAKPNLYNELQGFIKGNVVQFPREFLKNQNLTFRSNQKQFYLPTISFT